MNNKPYNHLKVDDGAFELDYIAKASDLNYPSPNFKPHWNILFVRVSEQFSGTFEECIDWMSQFYTDKFDDARTADALALELAKEFVREAEIPQQRREARDKLWNSIEEAVNDAVNILGAAHVTSAGIMYFTMIAKEMAPDKEEAIELITLTIDDVMEGDHKAEVIEYDYH